jgi:hypothetical protein
VKGLGFRVKSLEFGVWGLGFRSGMLAERTASRNVFVLFYFINFIYVRGLGFSKG